MASISGSSSFFQYLLVKSVTQIPKAQLLVFGCILRNCINFSVNVEGSVPS